MQIIYFVQETVTFIPVHLNWSGIGWKTVLFIFLNTCWIYKVNLVMNGKHLVHKNETGTHIIDPALNQVFGLRQVHWQFQIGMLRFHVQGGEAILSLHLHHAARL